MQLSKLIEVLQPCMLAGKRGRAVVHVSTGYYKGHILNALCTLRQFENAKVKSPSRRRWTVLLLPFVRCRQFKLKKQAL